MNNNLKINPSLYIEIKQLIEEARFNTAQAFNAGLTILYWNVGKRINDEILKNKRAGYGKKIIPTLSHKLMSEYGKGFSRSAITRMCLFNEKFPDYKIVATLSHKLSWSHFIEILSFKNDLQREFYAQMCRIEQWSVRTLRKKIDSMLFERTAVSKKPEEQSPIGMILCAEGKHEQIELLQLDKSNIRVAEYITELLPKKMLQEKLHQFYLQSKSLIEEQGKDE